MYRLYLKTKQHLLEIFESIVEPHVGTVSFVEIEDPNAKWDSEDWYIEGFSENPINEEILRKLINELCEKDKLPLPDLEITTFEDKNWLEDMWASFPPQSVGPFFIHGEMYDGEVPERMISINLHAATAFGSGEHGTTAGCMLALHEEFLEKPWDNPLDLGCGSGILAIAMTKLHPVKTYAIDNDLEAVRVTKENAHKNHVEHLIVARGGEGLSESIETFDFIVANILAKPLIDLAPFMKKHLSTKGRIVLSGLLDWQEEDVLNTYLAQGFELKNRKNINRWITLIMTIKE